MRSAESSTVRLRTTVPFDDPVHINIQYKLYIILSL